MAEWVAHVGRDMPVHPDQLVQVQIATSSRDKAENQIPLAAHKWQWQWKPGNPGRIVYYRVIEG